MKIIIISISQYREKDGIVNAISHDEEITFLVHGIFDPKSKFAGLNNYLTIADVELSEGNSKYKTLKNAKILNTPVSLDANLDQYSSLMLLAESTKSLLQDEEKHFMFDWLESAILAIKKSKDVLHIDLIYLANILKIGGYEFEVNCCVFCGSKKNIQTFSFNDGGFICGDCLKEMEDVEKSLSVSQMLLVRMAFNATTYDIDEKYLNREDELFVLNKFFEFIKDSYSIRLTSSALIKD